MNKYIIIYKMTGTNATIDGMGFDRVNQSDAQTDIIVGVSGLFSYISGTTIIGASVPTDNIILTGSLSSLDVIATNGSFTGINIGSNAFIDGNLTSTNLDVGQTINTITGSFTQVQVSMLLDAKSDVNVGNNLSVTGSIVTVDEVHADGYNDADGGLYSIGVGSGADFAYGGKMLAGFGTLSAGSDAWIVFEDGGFDDTPFITLGLGSLGNIAFEIGSLSAGSAYIYSNASNTIYTWHGVALN